MSKLKRSALHAAWWMLSPTLLLLLPQALYVKRTTLRLPEAQPLDTQNAPAPAPAPIHLWHLGESTVAGVGVAHLSQGLSAQLAQALSEQGRTAVSWQSLGVNGIRLSRLIDKVMAAPAPKAQLIVVTMGVNDTTGFTSVRTWQRQLRQLVHLLQRHNPNTPVVFTQVPPMMKFPALPAPLKFVIGLRAQLLDAYLQKVCEQEGTTGSVHYVKAEPDFSPQLMAEDGYHPSALGYQTWAQALAPKISELMTRND